MPKGKYDFYVGVDVGNSDGYLMLTLDDVEVYEDMNLSLSASSAKTRTDITHIGPNGENLVIGNDYIASSEFMQAVLHGDKVVRFTNSGSAYIATNNPDSRYKMTRLDMMATTAGVLHMVIPVDFSKPSNGSDATNWMTSIVPIASNPAYERYREWKTEAGDPDYYYSFVPFMVLVDGKHLATGGLGVFNSDCPANTVGIWEPTGYDGRFEMIGFPTGSSIKSWHSSISGLPLHRTEDGLRQYGIHFTPDRTIFLADEYSPKLGKGYSIFNTAPSDKPIGNCAPIMTIIPDEEYFDFTYSGRNGESMGYASDYYFLPSQEYWDDIFTTPLCDLKFYKDDMLLTDNRMDFPYDCDWGEGGDYRLEISTSNVLVDGTVSGFSRSVSCFNTENGSWIPPTITSLQIIDSDSEINDHLESTAGAYVNMTAGLFNYADNYEKRYVYAKFNPVSCTSMEYAPYGTEDFTALPVSEANGYVLPGYGSRFEASLKGISAEDADAWYDLRISISDQYGSTQTQTISPAFMVKGLSSIETISTESLDLSSCKIFTMQGIRVKNIDAPGIYIIMTPEGRTFKVAR